LPNDAAQRLTRTWLYQVSRQRVYHLELRAKKVVFETQRLLAGHDPGRHDPYRVLRLDPADVTHVMERRLPPRVAGRLLDGDWDLAVLPTTATALHRGLHQRFREGRDWRDTDLHPDRYARRCANEPPQYEKYSDADFLRRGEALDRLYAQLERHGFRDHTMRGEPVGTEMTVAVTRDGVYARHAGGMHRLVMAQLIGLDCMPIRVLVVHTACAGTPRDPFHGERGLAPDRDDERRRNRRGEVAG
jgi:hypothetical protein